MPFAFHKPETIDSAIKLAGALGDTARFIAGGTDLVIQMHRRRVAPAHLIGLADLGLDSIVESPTHFSIGAMTTHNEVVRHAGFQRQLAALAEASAVIGGRQVRNIATVGGNIVNASPAADLVPVLLTLDAELELKGATGTRALPLDGFLVGRGRGQLGHDEILTAVRFAKPPTASATAFLKAGRRKAMEISVVCVAAHLVPSADGKACDKVAIAVGAAADRVFRATAAEAFVRQAGIDGRSFDEAGRLAAARASPIDDVRASARYRRLLVATLVERALMKCRERLGAAGR